MLPTLLQVKDLGIALVSKLPLRGSRRLDLLSIVMNLILRWSLLLLSQGWHRRWGWWGYSPTTSQACGHTPTTPFNECGKWSSSATALALHCQQVTTWWFKTVTELCGQNMSRQRSLKELFPNNKSMSEEENDNDLDELIPEEEENEDDLGESLSVDFNDTAAVVPGQETLSSEIEDEALSATGTETENEIINKPNQPCHTKFPSKTFGKQQCCFNSKWFDNDKWSTWLHWDDRLHKAFCYICRNISQMHQLTSKNAEDAFISVG